LSGSAGVVWDELAPICLAMGTLTVADTEAFSTLCELQATFRQAAAGKDGRELFRLKEEGAEGTKFEVVIDSVLKLERETANALRPYYEVFGLTPVARARISVPKKPEAPASKWAGVLK
jgi:hypothetical protein